MNLHLITMCVYQFPVKIVIGQTPLDRPIRMSHCHISTYFRLYFQFALKLYNWMNCIANTLVWEPKWRHSTKIIAGITEDTKSVAVFKTIYTCIGKSPLQTTQFFLLNKWRKKGVVSTTLNHFVTGLWWLSVFSTIFQLYRVGQIYCWREPEYPEKTTDLPHKLLTNLMLHRVHLAMSGIQSHNVSGYMQWLQR